ATSSGEVVTLPQPKPGWLTPDLEAKILAAGSKGVDVRFDKGAGGNAATTIEPNCLGTAPPHAGTDGVSATAVSAGTCMVSWASPSCTTGTATSSSSSRVIRSSAR